MSNKRKKICLIFSLVSSMFLVVACFICNYTLNIFSFFFSLVTPLLFLVNLFLLFYCFFKLKRYVYIPLISVLLYFFFFSSPLQLNTGQDKKVNDSFSLMTFNARDFGSINKVRDTESAKKILDFVKSKSPDIVCFQEFSIFEFQSFSYYPYRFIGYKPGFEKTLQVIYSRYPIVDGGFIDFPNTRNQTIYADIKLQGEIVRVYNIHLQSFKLSINKSNLNFEGTHMIINKVNKAQKMQEEQVQIILNHTKTFKGKVIFAGDFNCTQYSKNYKYLKKNKEDSFTKRGFGLGSTYHFFSYPYRIDFILADSDIEILTHQNFNLKISDHEPILVELEI